jgi:chemotaxis protein MotB
MPNKIILSVLVVLLAAGLSACTVMQGTYQVKVDEADTLTKRLASLQKKYDTLAEENVALKVRNERLISDLAGMTLQKDKLNTDLAYVTGQRDKLAVDKEELDKVLQSKSDSLSQTIFEVRRKVTDLEAENGKLRERNASLQKSLDEQTKRAVDLEKALDGQTKRAADLEKELGGQTSRYSDLQKEAETLKTAKEEQVKKVSSTYESLLEKMKSEISKGQVTISELKGKLTLNMVDSILFDSGKAEVKAGGLEILGKVVSILKDVKEKAIRIEGHTDNVKIVGGLAKRFPTNWELSAARAINVARYLQDHEIDPGMLAAVAYAEWKPVATNDTEEGKARNRRIEIILVPKE